MQFRDLKRQYEVLKKDIDSAMAEVAGSSAFIMGKPVKELEAQLAEYVGVKHCISCANGTEALTLALKVWGIGPGDAVFVPDFTFFASAEVVSLEGATPIFVDVDMDTFNIDPIDLEKTIEKTLREGKYTPKVILPVDLFGLPADYPSIRKIADKYDLLILEDGAQGFGGGIGGNLGSGIGNNLGNGMPGKRACGFGDIGTTSFFPAKPLGCYGDGGALFTDNDEWAAFAESYRVHGKGSFKYDNVRIGMNSRLDTLQAAILLVKFKAFKEYELADVNKAAKLYTEKLGGTLTGKFSEELGDKLGKNLPCQPTCEVHPPVIPAGFLSSWAQYTIKLENKERRNALQAKLKALGIPSMIYYPTGMHAQTAFADIRSHQNPCPNTEHLCDVVLSLPIHPYITEEEIDLICKAILE